MIEGIIVFREVLESSLIVGLIYTVLVHSNARHLIPKVWSAVGLAIVASGGIGAIIYHLKQRLGYGALDSLIEAIFLFITAALIYYVIFWLSKYVSDMNQLKQHVVQSLNVSSWSIFFLVFFVILREGFETVMFLLSSFAIQGTFSYIGFFTGGILAGICGVLFVIQGKRWGIKRFFKATTLCLVLFASGMMAYGTHEIEEYLVDTQFVSETSITRPWVILRPKSSLKENDKSILYRYNVQHNQYIHVFHDKGSFGIFLKGFFGYNSNPNQIELIVWILSMGFGLTLWRRAYSTTK